MSNRLLIAAVLIPLLSACGLLQPKPAQVIYTSSDAAPRVAQQQWRLTRGEQQYILQVVAERSAQRWQWVLMSSLGQRLATVSAEAAQPRIEIHQSHPALSLLPELIEAWQLSFWPLADLQQHAAPTWQFSDTAGHRRADFSGILRAAIDYEGSDPWQGRVNYHNHKRDFRLIIDSQLLN